MADPKDKSWLEKAEDYVSDSYDQQRKQIPEWDNVGRIKHDVEVGIMKGVYGGVKSLVSGAIDLLRLTPGVDPVYQAQVAQKAWPVAVKLAKETYIAHLGTPAEKQDQNERAIAFAKEVYKSFEADWDKAAATDGKRTELASKWISRGVFEVAALAVGAGEAKAAVKGGEIVGELGKLEEGAAILDEVTQPCKTVVMSREEILAEQAAKEAEAAKVARQEAVTKEMKAVEPSPEPGKAPDTEPEIEDWDEKTPKDGVPAVPPKKVPPGIPKNVLKDGDLVFGTYPNKEPRMTTLVDGTGAKLVTDLPNPIPGKSELSNGVRELSTDALDYAAREGKQVHFDLNGLDAEAALNRKGPYADSVTSVELRHIRKSWSSFDPKPKFYKDGVEVKPPWM